MQIGDQDAVFGPGGKFGRAVGCAYGRVLQRPPRRPFRLTERQDHAQISPFDQRQAGSHAARGGLGGIVEAEEQGRLIGQRSMAGKEYSDMAILPHAPKLLCSSSSGTSLSSAMKN